MKINSPFGLTAKQTQVLFSLQRLITAEDMVLAHSKSRFSRHSDAPDLKKTWLKKWDDSISNYLNGFEDGLALQYNDNSIKALINEIDSCSETTVWKYMILFECVLYRPYYPLSEKPDDVNEYKKLSLSKESADSTLKHICSLLSIDNKYISTFKTSYKKSIKSLSGYWKKVAITTGVGVAVVLTAIITFQYEIIAFFALDGLSGAAAISSGLAAMGGGAIAVGGTGMAGGMAVLIGGGTLVGAGAGFVAGSSLSNINSDMIIIEAAKVQVVLKEIVLAIQKDTQCFQEILFRISEQNNQLRKELIKLKNDTEANKKKIKNLEQSILYLEKLLNINPSK